MYTAIDFNYGYRLKLKKTMTDFADMVYSMGVPVVGGLMRQGESYFVDPYKGSDGNSGKSIKDAFRTLNRAEAGMVSGQGDTAYLVSGGTTTANVSNYLSATLVWDKEKANIVGLAAPTGISPRARIATISTQTTAINPLLQITAGGCTFANFQVFNGIDAAVAANGVEVTGARNYFYRVHIAGIGNAKNDVANAYSLKLTGASENLFEECTIGIDTIAKGTAANSEISIASASGRNKFVRCDIRTFAEAATHQFLIVAASGIEREVRFEDCTFFNPSAATTAVEMTEAIDINATQNGTITLKGCTLIGAADWEAGDEGLTLIDGAAPTAGTSGIAVATTV